MFLAVPRSIEMFSLQFTKFHEYVFPFPCLFEKKNEKNCLLEKLDDVSVAIQFCVLATTFEFFICSVLVVMAYSY
jgi:hypothetical protein